MGNRKWEMGTECKRCPPISYFPFPISASQSLSTTLARRHEHHEQTSARARSRLWREEAGRRMLQHHPDLSAALVAPGQLQDLPVARDDSVVAEDQAIVQLCPGILGIAIPARLRPLDAGARHVGRAGRVARK